jgi:hypothetical protein
MERENLRIIISNSSVIFSGGVMLNRITFFVSVIHTLIIFISSSTILYGQVPTDGLIAEYKFNLLG